MWQVGKSDKPREISTRDVGVGSYFYGKSDTKLEDRLSEQETRLQKVLDSIESGNNPSQYDDDLRHFVYTLAFRTRNVRETYVDAASQFMQYFIDSFSSQSAEQAIMDHIDASLDEVIREGINMLPEEQQVYIWSQVNQNPAIWDQLREYVKSSPPAVNGLENIREGLRIAEPLVDYKKAAKDGQIKGLTNLLGQDIKSPLPFDSWHVLHTENLPIILGDCCVFGFRSNHRPCPLFTGPSDCKEVYLPISKHSVLIGTRENAKPNLGISQINIASAEVSRDVFFSSTLKNDVLTLAGSIGKHALPLDRSSMEHIVEEFWDDMKDNFGG